MSRLIPLLVFLALLGVLLFGLATTDRRKTIASPLIGKPVPAFELQSLDDPDRLYRNTDLAGRPFVLNVWASWCPSCSVEHPWVRQLGADIDAPLVGLNWKDRREDARNWLSSHGDVWDIQLHDPTGRFGIDLGVYGAPETFVVDAQGIIRYKLVGPLTPDNYGEVLEQVRKLENRPGTGAR